MWPVMARGLAVAGASSIAVLSFERRDVGFGEPDRDFDGERHAVVREHEALERLVAELVVADGRNDERGRVGRGVLLAVDDDARGSANAGRACDARALGSSSLVKRSCGQTVGTLSRKSATLREARVAFALVVERALAQEIALRAVVGKAVDLAVIQLDRANGLIGGEAREAFRAQTAVGAVLLVLLQPRRDRRGRDIAVGFLLEARGGLFERVADVVVGERREDHAQADRSCCAALRGLA